MEHNAYIICEYCGILIHVGSNHIALCSNNHTQNYSENIGILKCYSCGLANQSYSNSQIRKESRARCQICVKNNIITKHMPYKELAFCGISNINTKLYNSIWKINYDKVKELLTNGANPNYICQDFADVNNVYRALYNFDGIIKSCNDVTQPTTPLKLCVFKFSDCMLTQEKQPELIKIAKLLIIHGANTTDAVKYFESRYGKKSITTMPYSVWYIFYELLKNNIDVQ